MSASGSAPDSTIVVHVPVPGASIRAACDHVMDASGDVILTLSNWAAPVRPWRLFWDMSDESFNEVPNESDDGSEADGEESGERDPVRKKRRVGDEEPQSDNPDLPSRFVSRRDISYRRRLTSKPLSRAAGRRQTRQVVSFRSRRRAGTWMPWLSS